MVVRLGILWTLGMQTIACIETSAGGGGATSSTRDSASASTGDVASSSSAGAKPTDAECYAITTKEACYAAGCFYFGRGFRVPLPTDYCTVEFSHCVGEPIERCVFMDQEPIWQTFAFVTRDVDGFREIVEIPSGPSQLTNTDWSYCGSPDQCDAWAPAEP